MIIEILIFLLTTLFAYYVFTYKRMHYYFDKYEIKYKPGVPMFGNFLKSTFLRNHFWEDVDDVYKVFPNERYVGIVEGTLPIILIRDLELVKNITVKDFDHFVDHRLFFSEDVDPLFGGSLFSMRGDKWRDMRMTLSPAFTGSKMRHIMPFMVDISRNFVEHLKGHQNEDINVLDLIHRYANDVIASAAFGLEINSLKQKDNEFYTLGQGIFNFTAWQRFNMFLISQFPSLAKKLNIKLFPEKTTNFFRNLVATTMEYREKNNVERPDMIQLLMEAKKGTLKHSGTVDNETVGFATVEESLKPQGSSLRQWTHDDLTAQVFIFFVAGFESSASVLVMACHELAINPDIEEQLYKEIREFKIKHEDLTFDNINELKYLDCVMNETLRKWSPALILDRVCQKTYELPPTKEGGRPFMLKPGDIVYNPVNSIHCDPKYYPNPQKFDPTRFADENKHNIKPFSFLPFGSGPRNCIGSRFALLELKVLLYYLALNFKIVKCAKTTDPIKLLPKDFNIRALGGTWVRFEQRH